MSRRRKFTFSSLIPTVLSGGGLAPYASFLPDFPGTSVRVNIYSDLNAVFSGDEGTVIMWYRDSDSWTDGTVRRLLNIQNSNATSRLIIEKGSTSYALTLIRIAGGGSKSITRYTAFTGWHQIAVTYSVSNSLMVLYFDGYEVFRVTGLNAWGELGLATGGTMIGATTSSGVNPMDGEVAKLEFYNVPLSAAQIQAKYTPETAPEQRLFLVGDSKALNTSNAGSWLDLLLESLTTSTSAVWIEAPQRFATGGYDMGEMLVYINDNLASATGVPDKIIINLGANDIPEPTPEVSFKADYNAIIDALQAKWPGVPIYLARPYRDDYAVNSGTIAGYVDDIATAQGAGVTVAMDETDWFATGIATYSSDGVHYNAVAQPVVASEWLTGITA